MSTPSEGKNNDFRPTNEFVTPMLTDLYQLTMAYAYFCNDSHNDPAVFDLFFRKSPFEGEFTIFAGLEECLRHVNAFKFSADEIAHLKKTFPKWKEEFWEYLACVDASKIKVYAIPEAHVVFPRVPLLRIEGPLAPCQLLETTLLCLVNYPSLIATNAMRHRIAAGDDKTLLEFGLRRAQGPDGAMSASRYAVMGGFDGTSNVHAGYSFGIAVRGTHAHSFVSSFTKLADLRTKDIVCKDGKTVNFIKLVREKLLLCKDGEEPNEGELTAFIAYAQAYPDGFLALVDTYQTLKSGVVNFLAVALALHECGYKAVGIRLDSGDLAFLSKKSREKFREVAKAQNVAYFEDFTIVASNDLNEEVLYSLKDQGHEIDSFGIGTHLVTCKSQPALGCVYKLVEIKGEPRIKVSQDIIKVTIPGRKKAFRLYDSHDIPVVDLMVEFKEADPEVGKTILCRDPFDPRKMANVTPSRVEPLHKLYWDGGLQEDPSKYPPLLELKAKCREQIKQLREDHTRKLNATPYKVSVSQTLFSELQSLWESSIPVMEIH